MCCGWAIHHFTLRTQIERVDAWSTLMHVALNIDCIKMLKYCRFSLNSAKIWWNFLFARQQSSAESSQKSAVLQFSTKFACPRHHEIATKRYILKYKSYLFNFYFFPYHFATKHEQSRYLNRVFCSFLYQPSTNKKFSSSFGCRLSTLWYVSSVDCRVVW